MTLKLHLKCIFNIMTLLSYLNTTKESMIMSCCGGCGGSNHEEKANEAEQKKQAEQQETNQENA
jgi:formate dehydrogenase assembly factor FdhD